MAIMPQTTGSSKACTKCGETKPLTDYYKKASAKDGRSSWCKVCTKASNRKWHEVNKERRAEYHRKWREANKEYIAEYKQELLAKQSSRVSRIRKLMKHFEGRTPWLEVLAATVANRSDAQGLCWVARDIEEFLIEHYYGEI